MFKRLKRNKLTLKYKKYKANEIDQKYKIGKFWSGFGRLGELRN